ncbi:X-ray repair cross-complementing protein 6 [Galleria mellonella]|uniref:X-ray repair cross-complementing protein 6 n=1 Tax=Galleria mellonella TaxID=7137 RepID=A0A6J1X827_GALME|nr:X-ray repair cross-complementing protein 6 [Galleria mellonella]
MDSEDEIEDNPQWKGVPGTIILINALNGSDITSLAHIATCGVVKQYLRSSKHNLIGVCYYGVKNSNATNLDAQDVKEIFPLSVPTVNDFKNLQIADPSKLEKCTELKMSDALWLCNKMFINCKKQLLSRTIIILTKLDIAPMKSDQKPCCSRAADLASSNVQIEIINISQEQYKVNPFYEDFFIEANNGKDVKLPPPVSDCKGIENLIQQQSHRHLAVSQLTLHIGEGFDIGVGVYRLLTQSTYTKSVNLVRDNNTVVTTVNKTMKVAVEQTPGSPHQMDIDEEETKTLLKSEIIHYQDYGGEKINFTDEEKKNMTNPFGPPMIKLLGFKPESLLCKEKWFIKPGYFLYPNEDIIEGSTVVFKALYKACAEMSMVALCMLCTRVNSRPYIVALSPCSNPLGLNVEIGFNVIHIPFVENIRNLPIPENSNDEILPEHKSAMQDILHNLKFDYKADMFENPKLQSQYRNIEAAVLSEENVEPFKDTTKPSQEKFQTLHADLFEELFGPFGAVALKRSAPTEVNDIDEDLLQKRIKTRNVNAYTVPQLKNILKYKNIPNLNNIKNVKKNELVEEVYKHCTV